MKSITKNFKNYPMRSIVIASLVLFVFIPGCINLIIIPDIGSGSDDGWLGFWGGYLGAILGFVGAMIVIYIQLGSDGNSRKEEKVDNTFFNLLNLHNEIKKEVEHNKDGNLFEDLYTELKKCIRLFNVVTEKKCKKEYFYSNRDYIGSFFDKTLDDMLKQLKDKFQLNDSELTEIKNYYLDKSLNGRALTNLKKSEPDFIDLLDTLNFLGTKSLNENDIDEKIISIISTIHHLDTTYFNEDTIRELSDIVEKLDNQVALNTSKWISTNKNTIIESAFKGYYDRMGKYFRIFHRVIKYVNNNVSDQKLKNNYIGFIRAMLNEKEIVLIYYNSFFTQRGDGLGDELKQTHFFGDSNDLNLARGYLQHFSKELLFWEEDDVNKMLSFLEDN